MINLLITGSSGYIGTATKNYLIGSNINVLSLDKDDSDNRIDLLDIDRLKDFMYGNKIDAVLHLAAFKSIPESILNPSKYLDNNVSSSSNLFLICEELNIPVVNASSAAIYNNDNPYSESKVLVESLLSNSKLSYINLRYFNIGGLISKPNDKQVSNLFDVIRFSYLNNKRFIINANDSDRNYTHIKDIAKFNVNSVMKIISRPCRETMDVYSNNKVSTEEVLLTYRDLGVDINYALDHSGPPKRYLEPSGNGLIKKCLSIRDIVESEIKYGIY